MRFIIFSGPGFPPDDKFLFCRPAVRCVWFCTVNNAKSRLSGIPRPSVRDPLGVCDQKHPSDIFHHYKREAHRQPTVRTRGSAVTRFFHTFFRFFATFFLFD
jgi:hypothetical protein